MNTALELSSSSNHSNDETLFQKIASDIKEQGYSINPMALPDALTSQLFSHLHNMANDEFEQAGIGRKQDHMHNGFVRNDQICWINGSAPATANWLNWTEQLQRFLNRRLFLGLFSFESHFAHYRTGDFYKRHLDAFKGEANRVLSIVVYLNPDWLADDGGELVLYTHEDDTNGIKVTPSMGTIVAFLSEEFPHEVLKAQRDRYSIAGWYRVNSSTVNRADPPI